MSEMWNRVPWMKPVDTAILNLLSPPKPLELTPSNIAINIDYDSGYVAKRCKDLEARGLLKSADRDGYPAYSVTSLGEDLSDRNMSAREILHRTALPSDYGFVD